jgi:type IV secretory pathway TrbD component
MTSPVGKDTERVTGRSRLEPTVFLTMISPFTVGLMAGVVAGVVALGGRWWLAVLAAIGVWGLRVLLATRLARRVRALPRRIDPFALREPWRFFVRDALKAQARLGGALASLDSGPRRDRLHEISTRVDRGVVESWEVAQRGQRLSDSRRASGSDRMRAPENDTRERLGILGARLEEAVGRAVELSEPMGAVDQLDQLDQLAGLVDGIVGDLESLRLGLDAADGETA